MHTRHIFMWPAPLYNNFPHYLINKILSIPSIGREVKPFAPCRRFEACKRSLNGVKRRHFGKITGPFSPTVPPFAARSARVDGEMEVSGSESGNV
jgi:hypothetical protein